jgi:hypothetical protein
VRITILAVCFAALAACGPAKQTAASTAPGCAAEAQAHWAPAAKTNFLVVAKSAGADCAAATATITISSADGKVLHTFEAPTEVMRNTIFAEANTPEGMQAALASWIDPRSNSAVKTTNALPEWKADAEMPGDPEFPFMPAEGMTRAGYSSMRASKQPIYCYVQGGESQNCLALDEKAGTLTSVGLQRFPG